MSAVLFSSILLFNQLGGKPVLNLHTVLSKMAATPEHPDLYWIYFMLFSTLLPTLFHFAVAGASVSLWFPETLRHWLVDEWHNNANKKIGIWFYVSVMPIAGFVLAPALLLFSLWWLVSNHGLGLGMALVQMYLGFL
jgi:hypothetical protein